MTDFVFIDSGVGGIPYMTALLKKMPDASCVYVADTKNFPYGVKTHEQVVNCVISLVKTIKEKIDPSVIVIACNTMSVNALENVRKEFPEIKFVGTVPAIKLAAKFSKKRCIGLLATKATCENPYNIELKNKFASDCTIVNRADPELISFIEHNAFTATHEESLDAVKPAVDFFREKGCDAIILGCTHFLNFTEIFNEACNPDIKVVDSVDGVVRHSLEVLNSDDDSKEKLAGDFKGVSPLGERVADKPTKRREPTQLAGAVRGATWLGSEGETSPFLYITGFRDTDEENQYNVLCSRYGIKFGGMLNK